MGSGFCSLLLFIYFVKHTCVIIPLNTIFGFKMNQIKHLVRFKVGSGYPTCTYYCSTLSKRQHASHYSQKLQNDISHMCRITIVASAESTKIACAKSRELRVQSISYTSTYMHMHVG